MKDKATYAGRSIYYLASIMHIACIILLFFHNNNNNNDNNNLFIIIFSIFVNHLIIPILFSYLCIFFRVKYLCDSHYQRSSTGGPRPLGDPQATAGGSRKFWLMRHFFISPPRFFPQIEMSLNTH